MLVKGRRTGIVLLTSSASNDARICAALTEAQLDLDIVGATLTRTARPAAWLERAADEHVTAKVSGLPRQETRGLCLRRVAGPRRASPMDARRGPALRWNRTFMGAARVLVCRVVDWAALRRERDFRLQSAGCVASATDSLTCKMHPRSVHALRM